MKGIVVAVIALALLTLGATAKAQEVTGEQREAARERFARGVERMRVDDYVGAAAELEKALELAPYAVIRFNLGVAYAKLDEPVKAAVMLEQALADPGNLSAARIQQAKRLLAEQQRRLGELMLEASESGALVRINGAELGRTPLEKNLRLAAGTHFVEVVKQGFAPTRREVMVKPQSVARVRVVLDATEKPLGQLWIRSRLIDAEIWLDGHRVARTPLNKSIPVLAGRHHVEVKRSGYRTARESVEIGQGATAEVSLTPTIDDDALDDEGGYLAFGDDWADELFVTVDGKRRGLYRSPLQLPRGVHVVRVERDGFYPTTLHIDIARGVTKTQQVVLEPTVQKLAEVDREESLYRGFAIGTLIAGAGLVGGGIGYTVWNENLIDDLNAIIEAPPCPEAGRDDPECVDAAEKLDRATARRPLGYVLAGVGGALMVTSLVLFLIAPDGDDLRPETDERFDALIDVSPDGGFLGVRGSF